MARVPYPDRETLSPETQELVGKLPALNIFRMMAGGEGLLGAFVRLGDYLLNKSKLDPVVREIAIIRVGVLSNARYEVFQHERIARRLGMTEPVIAAIHHGPDDPAFDELQRLVMAFTDDVVRNVRASDETFQPLVARLSLQALQELTVAIGYYMTACRFLENFGVEIEDGAGPDHGAARRGDAAVTAERMVVLPAESQGTAPGRGRLSGRRILVIGAGQNDYGEAAPPIGNGRAMAVLFAREGAHVAVADRDEPSAAETVARIHGEGGNAVAVIADMSKPGDPPAMVSEAHAALGGLDGLVYNVGVGDRHGLDGATPDSWDRVLAVNLRGAMLTARAALPVLSDGSSIVFTSSIAGIKPGSRIPAYDASKAALGGLMRHVAFEGAARTIRANIVAPGLMDTSIGRAASRGRPSRASTPVPLGRQGTAWETAYLALFLISNEAAYITGQTVIVDGGLTSLR